MHGLFGRFCTGDVGIVLPFESGHGYTGEEAVEFSIHGSFASTSALLSALCGAGARLAGPGEFTLRAFMNGRLDLTQAEAVRDTIEARTAAQLANATLLLSGALNNRVRAIRESILLTLAEVEARADFGEELGDLDRGSTRSAVAEAYSAVSDLVSTLRPGRILREGLRVALVGLPNAGKSSLLNALCGSDRAITSPHPGTTRDYIEADVDIDGVVCTLVDTAGLRISDSAVEQLGVERARSVADGAHLVLYVYDAHVGWTADDQNNFDSLGSPKLLVANKCDLSTQRVASGIQVSAAQGTGLDLLGRAVLDSVGFREHDLPLVAPRHGPLLLSAQSALLDTLNALDHELPDDLLAVGLRSTLSSLGQVIGLEVSPDILDEVFAGFCIGK